MVNCERMVVRGVLSGLFVLVAGCLAVESAGDGLDMAGLTFDQGELYVLTPDEPIFLEQTFCWRQPPAEFAGKTALRTPLDAAQPLTIEVHQAGVLYAALWQWDFGFLDKLPEQERTALPGWEYVNRRGGSPLHRSGIRHINWFLKSRLDPAPHAAPEPFAPLRLYRRTLLPGKVQLPLDAYVGQWIIVGYEPDTQVTTAAPMDAPVTVTPTKTRHNICDPETLLTLTAEKPASSIKIYHDGALITQSLSTTFAAPQEPGRYCMNVDFENSTQLVPLTVAYPPITKVGWPDDYFPVHFFGGWGYVGLFVPNPQRLGELATLNQFEMGANTYFDSPKRDELLDALNVRTIISVRGKTKYQTRTVADEAFRPSTFVWEITHHGPFDASVLGFYVEDEPPSSIIKRMKQCQDAFAKVDEDRHLVYCLHGDPAPQFWRETGATIRQTRAYPIRRHYKDDFVPQIKRELADYLIKCQNESDRNTPLWLVAQTFGDMGKPDGINRWDQPTPQQYRLMMHVALARGVKGLTYFCYDASPAGKEDLTAIVRHPYVPYDDLYDEVAAINAYVTKNARFLNSLTWQRSIDVGDDRLDVQLLRNHEGKAFAYVTNLNYNAPAQKELMLDGLDGPFRLDLPAGGGVIIDLAKGRAAACSNR